MLCISLRLGRPRREHITVNPNILSGKKMRVCASFFSGSVMLFINSLPRGRDSVFPSDSPLTHQNASLV